MCRNSALNEKTLRALLKGWYLEEYAMFMNWKALYGKDITSP